jgi:hypothetical protein
LLVFRHTWNNYLIASGLEHKEERDKLTNLHILFASEACLNIKNLSLTADDQSAADKILDAFERHKRAMFNTAKQEPDETTDEYVNL